MFNTNQSIWPLCSIQRKKHLRSVYSEPRRDSCGSFEANVDNGVTAEACWERWEASSMATPKVIEKAVGKHRSSAVTCR